MPKTMLLEGFIKDVRYQAHLADELMSFDFDELDANKVKSYGSINHPNGQIAYSKWTSPKRTRTYPFARLYNAYNAPKIVTIIPVMKDEGMDGDLDKIQYSTISWMNLLNVYIVLAYYEKADKNRSQKQKARNKLTNQKFNTANINEQINSILSYKQSALHWNRSLVEDHLASTYEKAIHAYESISAKTKVQVHSRKVKIEYLKKIKEDHQHFKDSSLKGSQGAALRELKTKHAKEYLEGGEKSIFLIKNYLGGIYYLTADEILRKKGKYIIQESKNSTKKFLPSLSDIKDGLFKLILFANLDSLKIKGRDVQFSTCLKLTGYKVKGNVKLPCTEKEFDKFVSINKGKITKGQVGILKKLNQEATHNRNLAIEIGGNNG